MIQSEIEIIRRTVSILDSVDYRRYSEGKAADYLHYAGGVWTDERKLIAPILFPKLLEEILGFKLGETIGTQEAVAEGRDIPDYVPADTRTHPFLFDCKGMDTSDLSKWYDQIRRYLETENLKYGILVNMRDLGVYTGESQEQVEAFRFSFAELYKGFKGTRSGILDNENTKRFLRFVESFRYTPLTLEQKLKRVTEAKHWTGNELLNVDLLTKRLHYIVGRIHEDVRSQKDELSSLEDTEPERARAIAQEVEVIASEIERGRKIEEATHQTLVETVHAPPESVLGRALDLFFFRIGYFTMTRLLLARAWEDIGFIDQTLYDGGLARLYENYNREIRRVLKHAFTLAAERYRWLFNVDNNYTWYEPSDETLIEVLYELSNFCLGKLNQDVLGSIYEEYIDKVDKRKKGQYYTPREIVEFIWNRVGFIKGQDFFTYSEGKREPRLIFDPATGSGGFLVEAARRIREDSDLDYADFNDILDIRTAILTGIFGSEISPFPYYITEVNLLIQLTAVIKRMMDMQRSFRGKGTPALSILPIDALYLYNPEQLALEKEQYDFDQTRDLLPVDSQKRMIFEKVKKTLDRKFSYCCANPPYIGEKGNKALFRATLSQFPYWGVFYQGKMDYLYFFIVLGLSKLRDDGKLGFITTDYWPTADGASQLRKYILRNAKIQEMVFFEDVKIFEYAMGQHNMVFVLEKCSADDKAHERAENRIRIVRVLAKHQEIPGKTIREKLKFLTVHIQKHIGKTEWQDEYIKVFWSGVKQGELPKDGGAWWDLRYSAEANDIKGEIRRRGEPLAKVCDIDSGIQSGADKVTESNVQLLPSHTIQQYDVKPGDGIFVLSQQEADILALSDKEKKILKPFYKNSDIGRYFAGVGRHDPQYIIYTTKDTPIHNYPAIESHLEKFKPILENKREAREGRLPWYSLHWPRAQSIFEVEKIINPQRSEENTFGFTEEDFYASVDVYFITRKKGTRESLKYICGLLNSTVIKFWLENSAKPKGRALELYYTPLSLIPIRRIDFDCAEDVQLHDAVVGKVNAVRQMLFELVGYERYFQGTRLIRLKRDDPLPDLNLEAIVQSLSPEDRFSLRTHPRVKARYAPDLPEAQFIVTRTGEICFTLEGTELKLYAKGKRAIFIRGEEKLLEMIADIVKSHEGEPWASLKEMPIIPATVEGCDVNKRRILEAVSRLRAEIQSLQDSIDAAVLRLYGMSGRLPR